MTIEELQNMIDQAENSPEKMLKIGEMYRNGDVLCDRVASEAWLKKVLESGETVESVRAMELLTGDDKSGRNIISDRDFADICSAWKKSKGGEKEYLKKLLESAEKERKSKYN